MKKSLGPNTWLCPTPVLVVGSFDAAGRPNAMVVAWGGVCCSRPPCIAISIRPACYSHDHILQQKAFTVNLPSSDQTVQADYLGSVSGKTVDKFKATGLTPVRSAKVNAPYIQEFPIVLECRLLTSMTLGSHTHMIGEIVDILAEDAVVDARGSILWDQARPVAFVPGANLYLSMGETVQKAFSASARNLKTGS